MLMSVNIHMRGAWPRPPACSSRSRRAALSPLRRGSGPRSPLAALGLAAARPAVPRSSEPRVWELPSPPRHHHGVTAASERSAQRNSSALLLPKFGFLGSVCPLLIEMRRGAVGAATVRPRSGHRRVPGAQQPLCENNYYRVLGSLGLKIQRSKRFILPLSFKLSVSTYIVSKSCWSR